MKEVWRTFRPVGTFGRLGKHDDASVRRCLSLMIPQPLFRFSLNFRSLMICTPHEIFQDDKNVGRWGC
jgi:hypothetical protein